MLQLNGIQEMAEQALAMPGACGGINRTLVDRAQRVLRHCGGIAELEEIRRFQVDRECLSVAALFCEVGLAQQAGQSKETVATVRAQVKDADLRDFSTQIVHERLGEILNPRQMERVCSTIIEAGTRGTKLIEAMILSDACNLEDMGAVGLFNSLAHFGANGRGVGEVLDSWKRKIDYGYWNARVRESFRFEAVRRVALERLAGAMAFMEQLTRENRARDLEDRLLDQTLQEPTHTKHEAPDELSLRAMRSAARRGQLLKAGRKCEP